jgi:polar amino acid transport system substrate-binding protein
MTLAASSWTFPALGVDASTNASADPRVADLVRSGKLRLGVGLSAVGATKDPATGELRGVAVDLGRSLAERLGVAFVPVEYPSPPKVLDGIETGAWDVGVFAIDRSRLDRVAFTPPYLEVDTTYLVPAGSSIRKVTDADQAGVRIAVLRNSVELIFLRGLIQRAQLRVEATTPDGFDLLRAGTVDALASSRPTLLQLSTRLAGSRVLEDRFGAVEVGMAVPKGQTGLHSYVSEFIENAKASGVVQRAIERAGMRGAQVAPATAGGDR